MSAIGRLARADVRRRGTEVALEINGMTAFQADWSVALAIGQAIAAKAREAEEEAKASLIVADQALIIRSGLGNLFGLTSRLDIMLESVKEAKWSRVLRRALPGGIKSTAVVGTPTIIKNSQRRDIHA